MQRKPLYHRWCYRVDLNGQEICQGQNIQDAKRRAVKYLNKHGINDFAGIKIYYLHTVEGDIEVDNNLENYV